MSDPTVTVTIYADINGTMGKPLATLTLDNWETAGIQLASTLRSIADRIAETPVLTDLGWTASEDC